MPLPATGAIPFVTGHETHAGERSKSAYLIKFPEEIWNSLQNAAGGSSAGGGMKVSTAADGRMALNIPNLPPIPLDSRSTGTSSEIHTYNPSAPSLALTASASTRLTIPLSSASTARAADKLKAQNEAIERERKERAIRVEGSAPPSKSRDKGAAAALASSAGMGRTHSSPQMTASTSAGPATAPSAAATSSSAQPMIPLKTRVMQLLALGPTTVSDIVRRVGGDEQNVMRVVNVVGRAFSTHPPTYTLLPNQYSKIKIGPGQWKYTYAEQQQVIRLAREAFDELGLDADAEERVELDRKEQEASNGYASSSTSGSQVQAEKTTAQAQNATSTLPVPTSSGAHSSSKGARTDSPAPTPSGYTVAGGSKKNKNKTTGPQSKIARERAKFMAERGRSTSAPNTRNADGVASPRIAPTPVQASDTEEKVVKERSTNTKPAANKANGKRRASTSRDYSSDEEDEDVPEHRGTSSKTEKIRDSHTATADKVAKNKANEERPSLRDKVRERDKAKEQQERERGSSKRRYSESSRSEEEEDGAIREDKVGGDENGVEEEEGEIRGRPKIKISPTHKRKPPPPELKLDGATPPNSASASKPQATVPHPASAPPAHVSSVKDREPDPESLRERYEELFPAYQQLTKKLAKVHQSAENGGAGLQGLSEDEVGKMVKRWERWHHELGEIRRWFGDV
ncbi:hypothetical protein IAT40_004796 [Kwoniella sp. CBS 6097]